MRLDAHLFYLIDGQITIADGKTARYRASGRQKVHAARAARHLTRVIWEDTGGVGRGCGEGCGLGRVGGGMQLRV
jgi:hypothetical protein